jgi:hypothetical protein
MYLSNLGTRTEVFQSILILKNGFFGPKTLLYPLSIGKKTFLSNFEPYDLINGME